MELGAIFARDLEPRDGSIVETSGEMGTAIKHYAPDGLTLWSDDHIIESDPPRRLVHSWTALCDPELSAEPPTRVTWELDAQPGGVTKVTLVHDDLEGAPKTATHVAGGWMFVLSGLKTVLETGVPLSPRSIGVD